ncbi:S-type anion channel SLAH1 [Hibiscus syriacus]|uniref:S-type anion channel SLAH1 n=1 Tax=Hibiscus syriacus TaxID=106335 RepID=A0A6A2ZFJ7_HIBSY|nr:S-type anion channel SLAH4-like [Hibiscus syriacus]KAE8690346.1 S-type anion channel SLAH1 [Hibiscus syriacus]
MAAVVTSRAELQLVVDTPTANSGGVATDSIQCSSRLISAILTKFHAGYFRVSLSLGGQALLWKTLRGPTDDSHTLRQTLHLFHPTAFTVLWCFSFFALVLLSILYLLRCLFHFKMVKEEFFHHVGVNYLFAPSISWLLLLQSAPFFSPENHYSYVVLWWVVSVLPIVVLDVKIYGQWFTKGKKFLSAVANPTSLLSVIGNLVGAQAAANMGWKESAIGFFSLGMVHYLVLFVTLYQRLSGTDRLPSMLRPVFFLFFAAPSMASLAWQSIAGSFDTASKLLFFLSLFLFMSLVCRPTMFKRSMRRFSVAWWAYSFPLSVLALASMEYAEEVKGDIPQIIMLLLLAFSVLVSICLVVFTLLNSKIQIFPVCFDPISSLVSRAKCFTAQQNQQPPQTV